MSETYNSYSYQAYRHARNLRGGMWSRSEMFDDYPKISDKFVVQVDYWKMRLDGQSHNMAEMLALKKFPGTRTDVEFNKGRCNGNQFEHVPGLGDHYRSVTEALGGSTTGKFYCAQLADFPGDPTAWVSDRSDVLRVAREKNFSVEGSVEYRAEPTAPRPDVVVDPQLIIDETNDIMEAMPRSNREEVFDSVYQLRTGRCDPNPLLVSDNALSDPDIDLS